MSLPSEGLGHILSAETWSQLFSGIDEAGLTVLDKFQEEGGIIPEDSDTQYEVTIDRATVPYPSVAYHQPQSINLSNIPTTVFHQPYQPGDELGGTVPDSGSFSPATTVESSHAPTSPSPGPMSILPSIQKFPGNYSFEFDFGTQPKETKSTAWTYSKVTNKLYAQKDAMCPVGFKVNTSSNAGLYIRALPLYSRPEYVQEVVKRCPNHVHAPESANIPHKEHFVWCENQSAQYVQDSTSQRFAVKVPVDSPPVGTPWITYLFSFKCLNSCVGGPNRREMTMVFTLETANNEILGRQSFDLRICACPGRDRKTEESKMEQQRAQMNNQQRPAQTSTSQQTSQSQGIKRGHEMEAIAINKRTRVNDDESFNLVVKGRRNFEILCKIRDSLEMADLVNPAERERFTQQRRQNDRIGMPPAAPMHQPMMRQTSQVRQTPSLAAFNFSRQIKQDVVDSTQSCRGGSDYTDSSSDPRSVSSWLKSLDLAAYIDNFHSAGLHTMDQLRVENNFTFEDLQSMKLTKGTVSKIWSSLKSYRTSTGNDLRSAPTVTLSGNQSSDSQTEPDSQGSDTVSLTGYSQQSRPATSGSINPLLEVTRCSVKFTVVKKGSGHSQSPPTSSEEDSSKASE